MRTMPHRDSTNRGSARAPGCNILDRQCATQAAIPLTEVYML